MPVRIQRYRPDNGTVDGFGGFLLSPQLQKATTAAARDIAKVAAAMALATPGKERAKGTYARSFRTEVGPVLPIKYGAHTNPRVSARVVNTSDHGVMMEWGSGEANQAGGTERPQGGYSRGHRILLRAGLRVGGPNQRGMG